MTRKTDDLRIKAINPVTPPAQLHEDLPISDAAAELVWRTRGEIHDLVRGHDDRLLVVVGPCSIHDPEAAREYGARLRPVREALADDLVVVMRVYFEKPRTVVGWKGLINDPDLNGSFHINRGLHVARSLLLDLNDGGVPAGTEYLDLITPQYVTDLISWGAIGARTTESQVHRELASGLSCPVGFKNGTEGNLKIAVDAVRAARAPHHFLALTKTAQSAVFATTGNEDCHVILRGGREPNYGAEHVDEAARQLEAAGVPARLMIDLSHANSRKQPRRQVEVGHDVMGQISAGDPRIVGVMIESHLREGRQDVIPGREHELVYGQSITDACLGWADTEPLLREFAQAVRTRRGRLRRVCTA